jgi:hypothetical protein
MVNASQNCSDDTSNPTIQAALTQLSERDARAFRRKLREQRRDPEQYKHTVAELLAGVFVRMPAD